MELNVLADEPYLSFSLTHNLHPLTLHYFERMGMQTCSSNFGCGFFP